MQFYFLYVKKIYTTADFRVETYFAAEKFCAGRVVRARGRYATRRR